MRGLLTLHFNLTSTIRKPPEELDTHTSVVHHLKRVARLGLALLSVATHGKVVLEGPSTTRLVESVDRPAYSRREDTTSLSARPIIDLDAQVPRSGCTAVDRCGSIVTVAEDGVDVVDGVALDGVIMKVRISQDIKAREDVPVRAVLCVPDIPKRRDIRPLRRRPQPVIQQRRQQQCHIMAVWIKQRRELPLPSSLPFRGLDVVPVAHAVHHEGVHEALKLAHLRIAATADCRVVWRIAAEGAVAERAAGSGRVNGQLHFALGTPRCAGVVPRVAVPAAGARHEAALPAGWAAEAAAAAGAGRVPAVAG